MAAWRIIIIIRRMAAAFLLAARHRVYGDVAAWHAAAWRRRSRRWRRKLLCVAYPSGGGVCQRAVALWRGRGRIQFVWHFGDGRRIICNILCENIYSGIPQPSLCGVYVCAWRRSKTWQAYYVLLINSNGARSMRRGVCLCVVARNIRTRWDSIMLLCGSFLLFKQAYCPYAMAWLLQIMACICM